MSRKSLWRGAPRLIALAALVYAMSPEAGAALRLPHMLSDHAVLQRERPIHIWGWADPGRSVAVSFHAQRLTITVDDLGQFSGWLMPEKAGGPYTLAVSDSADPNAGLKVEDLLVGDVWFASGQSNMEMPLRGFPGSAVVRDADREIAAASHPDIRLLRFEHKASDFPLDDTPAQWTRCEPSTAKDFSAVAYFFGREVAATEHVPIGLIDSTWGGTPVDSWMSLESIAADASLMPVFASRARFAAEQTERQAMIDREKREDAAAKERHQPPPSHFWHPEERSWSPSLLYNGMIAPATAYTIRGFLWYQGESDSGSERSPMYARLFPAMIQGWRERWSEGSLPFLFVQISSFQSPPETWGNIRDAQRRTLSLADTAMAVSLDIGQADNVHPPDKQTVGHRLALGAMAISYGSQLEWSGPAFRQVTREGTSLRAWFDHAHGLRAQGAVRGFEVAGSDGRFYPASATIEGEAVLLRSDQVADPRSVRYAWANVTDANLGNAAGLPASTFVAKVP